VNFDTLNHPIEWKNWHYKNSAYLLASLLLLAILADSPFVDLIIKRIGDLGYIGAFLTGVLFVSIFTVAPAMVILYHLADVLNPLEVAVLAGLGAVIGDYLIFRFLKDKIFAELAPLFTKVGVFGPAKLFQTPYFHWLIPFVGAFIVASPFPDEVGISLMGLSKIKNWQFLLVSFLLNAVGIFLVVTVAGSF